jgi:hypothetical protein
VIRRHVTRTIALWLALAQPVLAQTATTAAPKPSPTKPSPTKPSPTKPAAKKPEPPQSDAAAQSGACGIGVIPHIGESFVLQSIGITVFGNDLKEVPIASWGLDDLIVARVRAAVGLRFAVRRIAYPANAFAAYEKFHLTLSPDNDLKEVVQTIAGTSGCERYVVVIDSGSQFGGSNQSVKGIGIVHVGGVIDRFSAAYLFALTALYVLDGHTFDVLKKGFGSIDEKSMPSGLLGPGPISGPNRKLEDFAWPPAPDAVTGLREPTRALLAASLDVALSRLLAP